MDSVESGATAEYRRLIPHTLTPCPFSASLSSVCNLQFMAGASRVSGAFPFTPAAYQHESPQGVDISREIRIWTHLEVLDWTLPREDIRRDEIRAWQQQQSPKARPDVVRSLTVSANLHVMAGGIPTSRSIGRSPVFVRKSTQA